ncbi:hypothetical protein FACS189429_0010 [Bacteroidia bacterium]|nr:hypothetical protein FACS189429_0010 [Bacteroidia bacterium]
MKNEREILCKKLINQHCFWSYEPATVNVRTISDEMLIEKTLLYLDLDDINRLFKLFPFAKIKQVWREQLVIQEPFYHSANNMLGSLYFNIKNPKRYIKTVANQHIKNLKKQSDEWFGSTYGNDF